MSGNEYFHRGMTEVSRYTSKTVRELAKAGHGKFYEKDEEIFGEVDGEEVCYSRFHVASWFDGLDAPSIDKKGLTLSRGQIKRIGKIFHKKGPEAARERIEDYIRSAEVRVEYLNHLARSPYSQLFETGSGF